MTWQVNVDTMVSTWDVELGRRRCTATAHKTGERCRQYPIRGGTVCRDHGGSAPLVRSAAKRRLQELCEPALEALNEAMINADWPQVVSAAAVILKHNFGSSITVKTEHDLDEKLSAAEWADRAQRVADILREKADRVQAIIDIKAEHIEEKEDDGLAVSEVRSVL